MHPSGWFALLLLWMLYFWGYRDYRLSLFRRQLFALRDELFDLAQTNELNFNDRAYGQLRTTINGTIQFGHQLGFFGLLFKYLLLRNEPQLNVISEAYSASWENACSELTPSAREKVKALRQRLHFYIAQQVVFTSFILFATLMALAFSLLVRCLQRRFMWYAKKIMSKSKVHTLVDILDSAAALRASKMCR